MAKKIVFPPNIEKEIINDYVNNFFSMQKLSEKYGCNERVFKRILKENNIHIRDLRESHALHFDAEYFNKIDSPEKAYWLGFIYADGCITNNNVFEIKLSIKDIGLLIQLKKDLNSKHNVGEYEMNTAYGNVKYCMFAIRSMELCNQLKDKGVCMNKTNNCVFPKENILPKEFVWDFIRGFFDGDGSVYITNETWKYGKYQTPSVSFTGTQDMLQHILEKIQKYYDTNTIVKPYYNGKQVYDLKFGGINLVNTIYHLLYDNATRFLQRKRDIFEYFLVDGNLETKKYHNIS